MTNFIYTLIQEGSDPDSLDYELVESSFDKKKLEDKAAELNREFDRRSKLWTDILTETKRRFDTQGGFWHVHQRDVCAEMGSGETHNLSTFGPYHTVVETPLV